MRKLLAFAEDAGIDTEKPFSELSAREKDLVLNGDEYYYGVKGYFKRLERKNYKTHIRVFLSRYRSAFTCEDCGGSRLKEKTLNVRIGGESIFHLSQMSVKNLKSWFDRLTLSAYELEIASDIMKEINSRLDFLIHVGLDYLTLSRLTRTPLGRRSPEDKSCLPDEFAAYRDPVYSRRALDRSARKRHEPAQFADKRTPGKKQHHHTHRARS